MNKKYIFALICFLGLIGIMGSYESTYIRKATCLNFNNDIYTFVDNSGNLWEWEEKSNIFTIGTSYSLIMDDNHTSTIHDDWIKKIKK